MMMIKDEIEIYNCLLNDSLLNGYTVFRLWEIERLNQADAVSHYELAFN